MRRNHSDIAAMEFKEYSRGNAQEYPLLNQNYDEDDEVPMFEPDDDELDLADEKELRGGIAS